MPDLDQFLDTLVADVTAGTRAPGASKAITQARRRRAGVAVAAAGAVVLVAVGGGLAAGTLGGTDRVAPIGEPTTTSPEPPTVSESAKASPTSVQDLSTTLHAILTQVPGWAVTDNPDYTDYDYAFAGPCSGNWGRGAAGEADGGLGGTGAGIGHRGFSSVARASDAAAKFVENLQSCRATAWRTQPIAGTAATLASSADGAAWIQRIGDTVWVLQVPTTDGPPPVVIQVEVAEWMFYNDTWAEQAHDKWAEQNTD